MYDTQSIGKRIAKLRKEHNLTQMALADALYVSYQAVSNWERGMSMPDITKLPELAQLLGVSIDELLGKPSGLVQSIVDGNTKEYIKENEVTPEALEEAASLSEPSQVDRLSAQIAEDEKTGGSRNITSLLPFLSQNAVEELALEAFKRGDDLTQFLPFLEEESVALLAENLQKRGKNIVAFLPFMEEEDVTRLAYAELEAGRSIDGFMPFMEWTHEVTEKLCKAGVDAKTYLPFLDEDDVAELAHKAIEAGRKIDGYLPFMDEDDVGEIALKAFDAGQKIDEYLPFMSEDDVAKLAKKAAEAGHSTEKFLPFMDEDDIEKMFLGKDGTSSSFDSGFSPIASFFKK